MNEGSTPRPEPHTAQAAASGHPELVGRFVAPVLIALFVLIGYAPSLEYGLWLDDHPHFLHLRDMGWSYRDAVESAYLAIPGEVADCWGRTEPPIRFYRPIAFTLMKVQYHIGRWRPEVMHGFSLLWHFVVALLVARLAAHFFGSRTWGTVAGCLMAVHPAHVGTVAWIACQTELMTTAFQLVAILAYSRHARWGERLVHPEGLCYRGNRAWLTGRLAAAPPLGSVEARSREAAFTPAIVVCLFFFLLALGCRENAVMLPVVCWVGDRLLAPGRRGIVRWEHIAMLVMAAAYVGVRHMALGQSGAPTWADLMELSGGNFAYYLVQKTTLYLLGIFCYVPTIPVITFEYADVHSAAFCGLAIGLIASFLVIWRLLGGGRAIIWVPAAIFILMAPTIPIYASAHHLYLPSIGGVLLITTLIALVGGLARPASRPLGRLRKALVVSMIAAHAVGLSTLTLWRGYLFGAATIAENLVIDDVVKRTTRPINSGDHLFFINLPVMAYYAPCAVRVKQDLSSLNGHVLAYAPYLTRMDAPARLEVVDAHRLRLTAPSDAPFFGGLGGDTIRRVLKLPKPQPGAVFWNDLYTVHILKADDGGIRELEFVFHKPLNSPEYHFYFGSPQFLAYPLDVSRPTLTRPSTNPVR